MSYRDDVRRPPIGGQYAEYLRDPTPRSVEVYKRLLYRADSELDRARSQLVQCTEQMGQMRHFFQEQLAAIRREFISVGEADVMNAQIKRLQAELDGFRYGRLMEGHEVAAAKRKRG